MKRIRIDDYLRSVITEQEKKVDKMREKLKKEEGWLDMLIDMARRLPEENEQEEDAD